MIPIIRCSETGKTYPGYEKIRVGSEERTGTIREFAGPQKCAKSSEESGLHGCVCQKKYAPFVVPQLR